MLFRRTVVPILLALAAITVGGGSNLAAQLSTGGTNLLVPITGVADLGGTFRGTMLIEQFAPQANNGVAAVGTVTGALTTSGTVRNLVVQVTLPLDIAASRARLNTDAALAQASCDVLHVELGSASINVLGSTIGLAPVAFDIASALQAGSTPSAVTAAQSGSVTAPPSMNTTQPAAAAQSSAPGLATTTAAPQAAGQTPLGSLLCSVDGFRNVSSPAQLAQQLNAILTALGTAGAS